MDEDAEFARLLEQWSSDGAGGGDSDDAAAWLFADAPVHGAHAADFAAVPPSASFAANAANAAPANAQCFFDAVTQEWGAKRPYHRHGTLTADQQALKRQVRRQQVLAATRRMREKRRALQAVQAVHDDVKRERASLISAVSSPAGSGDGAGGRDAEVDDAGVQALLADQHALVFHVVHARDDAAAAAHPVTLPVLAQAMQLCFDRAMLGLARSQSGWAGPLVPFSDIANVACLLWYERLPSGALQYRTDTLLVASGALSASDDWTARALDAFRDITSDAHAYEAVVHPYTSLSGQRSPPPPWFVTSRLAPLCFDKVDDAHLQRIEAVEWNERSPAGQGRDWVFVTATGSSAVPLRDVWCGAAIERALVAAALVRAPDQNAAAELMAMLPALRSAAALSAPVKVRNGVTTGLKAALAAQGTDAQPAATHNHLSVLRAFAERVPLAGGREVTLLRCTKFTQVAAGAALPLIPARLDTVVTEDGRVNASYAASQRKYVTAMWGPLM